MSVAIVSQSTARSLWPNADAVGQVLRLDPDPNSPTTRIDEPPLESRTFTVVGVARDVAGFRLAGYDEADIYLPTSAASREDDADGRASMATPSRRGSG